MKVYRIEFGQVNDGNDFTWILPDDKEEDFVFTSIDNWSNYTWYNSEVRKVKDDFFHASGAGIIAFDKKVCESDLYTILEMTGEIITVNHELYGDIYIYQCKNYLHVLDLENSKVDRYPFNNEISQVLDYKFHEHRLTSDSIFMIPESNEIFCYQGDNVDLEYDFKAIYEKHNFRGLIFIEV
ncbi:hypothetical protein [Flammeovirga agarivorans]|uniref:Uncharacterized protein n=1 Tax=Flammeovirga agarivorans TaxID=2726742 RepID=A0A7X8SI92_9BACT|nr:hypothetical protein [Flammeovirga agarivorans]NLR90593.1 hypothetical protein [Flammeovirga agarivorans]